MSKGAHFPKNPIQMYVKTVWHMTHQSSANQNCSKSSPLLWMATIKTCKESISVEIGKRESLYIVGGDIKGYSYYRQHYESLQRN